MLFKDTAKLKEYTEFTEVNLASIAPTIRMVEAADLVPVIGKELYKELNDAYNEAASESDLTDEHKALLNMCRKVIAPYASYNYIPKVEVLVSDAGARRQETATAKTAYGNQVINLREQKLTEAETAIEMLLAFLEENKEDYPEWTASDAFKKYRSLFIKGGAELGECVMAQTPYRLHVAIRAKMRDVEELNMRDALGNALFDFLKSKYADATYTFTDKQQQLLFFVKRAVANLALSFALPYLAVRIDANGITVVSNNSTGRSKDFEIRQDASETAKAALQRESASSGQEWITKTIKFLNDNYADFPQWPAPQAAKKCNEGSGNDKLKGTFGML